MYWALLLVFVVGFNFGVVTGGFLATARINGRLTATREDPSFVDPVAEPPKFSQSTQNRENQG
jgi:hypothetical protein